MLQPIIIVLNEVISKVSALNRAYVCIHGECQAHNQPRMGEKTHG